MLWFLNDQFFQFDESHCKCNIEGICGGQCVNRGSIIVPCCSLFNHSCFSNCTRVFAEKKKIVIVATKPIKKYQQVSRMCSTYNYLNLIVKCDKESVTKNRFLISLAIKQKLYHLCKWFVKWVKNLFVYLSLENFYN